LPEETLYFFNSLSNLYKALKKTKHAEDIERMAENFLKDSFSLDLKDKVKRFLEIPSVGFIPANVEYFKLYYELMQLYTNKLFYSTVVLSGVLCERICFDILLRKKISVDGSSLSNEQIASIFDMNLSRLFKLLLGWGLIKKETHDEMNRINDKRNEYVHPTKSITNAQKDALEMIQRITKILVNEFEVKVEPTGTVRLI